MTPGGQLEWAGAILLRDHALVADFLNEGFGYDLLERQHGRQQRPGLAQHEAHRKWTGDVDTLHRAEEVAPGVGLAADLAR